MNYTVDRSVKGFMRLFYCLQLISNLNVSNHIQLILLHTHICVVYVLLYTLISCLTKFGACRTLLALWTNLCDFDYGNARYIIFSVDFFLSFFVLYFFGYRSSPRCRFSFKSIWQWYAFRFKLTYHNRIMWMAKRRARGNRKRKKGITKTPSKHAQCTANPWKHCIFCGSYRAASARGDLGMKPQHCNNNDDTVHGNNKTLTVNHGLLYWIKRIHIFSLRKKTEQNKTKASVRKSKTSWKWKRKNEWKKQETIMYCPPLYLLGLFLLNFYVIYSSYLGVWEFMLLVVVFLFVIVFLCVCLVCIFFIRTLCTTT